MGDIAMAASARACAVWTFVNAVGTAILLAAMWELAVVKHGLPPSPQQSLPYSDIELKIRYREVLTEEEKVLLERVMGKVSLEYRLVPRRPDSMAGSALP